MRAAAAARQRKTRKCRTHAASTTRSLLAASDTGSVRAKARLKDHLTGYRSALEGAGAESAEDQRDILLALLVENIRSARGTPDAVARDLLECHRQRLVEQRAPLTPKELDMMNCTFAFDLHGNCRPTRTGVLHRAVPVRRHLEGSSS